MIFKLQDVEKVPEIILAMAERRRETTQEPLEMRIWDQPELYDFANDIKNKFNITLKMWNNETAFNEFIRITN